MKTILLLLAIILFATTGYAQPPGFPSTPDPSPIEGGIIILSVLAGMLGWKKLRNNKN